jgi:hypothetical protein
MRELQQRGFMVADGPFSLDQIARIARGYSHGFPPRLKPATRG